METDERITQAGYDGCSATLLPVGATLFSSRAPIGLVALAGVPVCTNQGFKSLVPGPRLRSDYLYYCMRHYADAVADLGTGSTFAEVSKRVMGRFEIPVPPQPEQSRIAAKLRHADSARDKQRRALARLDDFLAAVFDEMFGDPVTNPKGWPSKPIGEIGKVTTGNTPSRKKPKHYGGAVEWIKSGNIPEDDHRLTQADESLSEIGVEAGRTVEPGSILVVCIAGSRASIGRAALTDRTVAFNQQINAITPRSAVDPRFLYQQIVAGQPLIQAASTDGMKGIVSKGRLQDVELMVPPSSLQVEFVSIFDRVAQARERLTASGARLDALYASLAARAFRGALPPPRPLD